MSELYLKDNKLIAFEQWEQKIQTLKQNIAGEPATIKEVEQAIKGAIITRIPEKGCGIFFSGGIDSTLIAYYSNKHNKNIICISAGFQDGNMELPQDIIMSKKIANKCGLNYCAKIYGDQESQHILNDVLQVLELKKPLTSQDIVNIGVGMVIIGVKKVSQEKIFLSGLGSEELFAGYERHAKSDDIQEECWTGLINMWHKDLKRDCRLASTLDVDIRTPFLDKDLINTAMRVPQEEKIAKGYKKVVIRKIADSLGFPKEFSWRKKKAAQYGSGAHKMLQRLAKKQGFSFVKDYIESIID